MTASEYLASMGRADLKGPGRLMKLALALRGGDLEQNSPQGRAPP
jgi:hypothetical protein